jgi:hypothetical protein
MERGINERWMMFSFDANNVESLTPEEEKEVRDKVKTFLSLTRN